MVVEPVGLAFAVSDIFSTLQLASKISGGLSRDTAQKFYTPDQLQEVKVILALLRDSTDLCSSLSSLGASPSVSAVYALQRCSTLDDEFQALMLKFEHKHGRRGAKGGFYRVMLEPIYGPQLTASFAKLKGSVVLFHTIVAECYGRSQIDFAIQAQKLSTYEQPSQSQGLTYVESVQ